MPLPMPKISLNVPAFTNDDYLTSFLASQANNSTYGDANYWRCIAAPLGNANSGTLSQSPGFTTPFPVYLAYDLSGVAATSRKQVVLVWYYDTPGAGAYDPGLIGNLYNNQARDYTIDVNPAAGGSLPGSGWVNKVTVTNNTYHSRQHVLDMTGHNWIRINVTAAIGSASNNNVAMNMDIHDANLGVQDDWIFYGDSIASQGLNHDDQRSHGAIAPAQINASKPLFWPLWENGSIAGWTTTDMAGTMPNTFLPLFPGKYVGLPIGTNDASGGGILLTNFQSKMQLMITAVLAAGKIPVIPHIPWGSNAGIVANGPTLNGQIDALIAANPGCIAGPDLWAYFNANQSLISGDGIHPTDPAGYVAYRQQWVNWATANIYFNTLNTTARTAYKVRTVLKTTARAAYKVRTVLKTTTRTSFKIQLSGAGPKPYMVTGVGSQMFVRPFSTISSTATVIDQNNAAANSLVATVTVTFPDNSTASPQVSWIGNGQYKITYTTKGAGTMTEVWIFTDSSGSSIEQQRSVPCNF